jgi:D-alanyl-D-alanine carboxypeptidase/D-alanyl-D-alanine-endopeptidase (penicillin-binding protein 4)
MPASNQKIITGSVALSLLGPDYRWRTTYGARGTIRDGVLRGDLVVIGRGDPSISDHMRGDAMAPLREVADSLAAHGVRTIRGRLVAEGDAFPGPTLGFGWDWDDANTDYGAGVDETYFNEGFTRLTVRSDARGHVTTETLPVRSYPPMRLEITAPSASDTGRARRRIEERRDSATAGYVLAGTLAPGDSITTTFAYPDQQRAFLAALGQALTERGIRLVDAPVPVRKTLGPPPAPAKLDTLFTVASPTLREVLPALEKPSQNQIAEIFLRTIALERNGVGHPDSGRKIVNAQLKQWGVEPEREVAYRDGSGLSRHDYVTPRAIVKVLATIRGDTAFRAFYDALPIAGVDGTIANRMKGTLAERNVHAKTGTVDKARSLSGYVTTADGRMLIFSFLCNNYTVPTRNVERVQDAIAARLAGLGAANATTSSTP